MTTDSIEEPAWFTTFRAQETARHLAILDSLRLQNVQANYNFALTQARVANAQVQSLDSSICKPPRMPQMAPLEAGDLGARNGSALPELLPPADGFPGTLGELQQLTDPVLSESLAEYGLPVGGSEVDKRERLCEFIGLPPSCDKAVESAFGHLAIR